MEVGAVMIGEAIASVIMQHPVASCVILALANLAIWVAAAQAIREGR